MTNRKKKIAPTVADNVDLMDPAGSPARVLHVNGKPIPTHVEHLIDYHMTDEGIAELNANRAEPSGITMGAGEWDKNMQRRSDLADSDGAVSQVWDAADPSLEAVAKFGKPGMAHRLLSDVVVRKKGLRGWKPVVAPNGDTVKVGNMTLGAMPEADKNRRNAHYAGVAADAMKDTEAQIQETQDKLIRATGSDSDVRVLRHGERVTDSRNPDAGVEIGVSRSRGNQAAA